MSVVKLWEVGLADDVIRFGQAREVVTPNLRPSLNIDKMFGF